jgi:transcriptional regulator with XRE-family HTH domain
VTAMGTSSRIACQVGNALWRLRHERGLRQKHVAAQAGVTVPMLSRYEQGHQYPTLPTLVRVLRALDCSAEDFGKRLGPWGCV